MQKESLSVAYLWIAGSLLSTAWVRVRPDLTFSRGFHPIGDVPYLRLAGLESRVVAVVKLVPRATWSEFARVRSLMRTGKGIKLASFRHGFIGQCKNVRKTCSFTYS